MESTLDQQKVKLTIEVNPGQAIVTLHCTSVQFCQVHCTMLIILHMTIPAYLHVHFSATCLCLEKRYLSMRAIACMLSALVG